VFKPEIFSAISRRLNNVIHAERAFGPEKTPLDFVRLLLEVDQLPDPKAKKKLLRHQLKAVIAEHLKLPFQPPYAMRLYQKAQEAQEAQKISALDGIYFYSDVLDRCQRAINAALPPKRDRYSLEKDQMTQVLDRIELTLLALMEAGADATTTLDFIQNIPEVFLSEDSLGHQESTSTSLRNQGWLETHSLLSPEVIEQFSLPTNAKISCLVGEKLLYIMPQSPVHEGWNSMYVIVQTIYIPECNLWLLLHNQHIVKSKEQDWQVHHDNLKKVDPNYQQPQGAMNPTQHEAWIMGQLIPLDPIYQTTPAEEVFLKILSEKPSVLVEQQRLLHHYKTLLATLDIHSEYLLAALELEKQIPSISVAVRNERLFQAIFKTLSTLLQERTIDEKMTQEWLANQTEFLHSPQAVTQPWQARLAHIQASATITPWLSLPVISQLECLTLSFTGLTTPTSLPSLSLSKSQILNSLPENRRQLWKEGACRVCQNKNNPTALVGECDVCKYCEDFDTLQRSSRSKSNRKATELSPKKASANENGSQNKLDKKPQTIGLSSFVRGSDYQLARTA